MNSVRRFPGTPVLGLAFVALLTIAGCRDRTSNTTDREMTSVTVQTARLETLRATVTGSGVVMPIAAGDWTIYPPETGRIAELPKAEGDAIQLGDVLVRFDFTNLANDVAAREADVAAVTSSVERARADLTRISALFDRGYAPRNDFESAKKAVTEAEANLARTNQQLAAARTAAEHATIRARFAGVVAKRFHNEGDLVNGSVNDPVLRVVDPTRVQVSMAVSMQQLAQVTAGQPATIMSATSTEPATVVSRPMPTDPHAASQDIRLAFTTPSTLTVDTPVQVEILVAERPNVIALPNTAIVKDDDGATFVMIAGADTRAHRRDVRAGMTVRDRTEIISGVTPGDQVIVKSPEPVGDDALITIEK